MPRRLAVNPDAPAELIDAAPEVKMLREAGIEVRGARCPSEEDTIALAKDADAILSGMVPISRSVLESLPRLKVVVRYGVGYDNVDVEAATEAGVVVVNVPDYCVEEVSNQALAFLLAWSRRLTQCDRMLHEGRWGYEFMSSMQSVHRECLGVVGCGRIGLAMARKGLALGMEVVTSDPGVDADALRERGLRPAPLDELLAQSDYVSVHTPLLPATHHLIGAAELARMKPSAFLINTSRGPVVDESALVAALQDGRIAGAGLDVFEHEPLPESSPLRQMPNVILSPHMGAQSPLATAHLRRQVAEEVIRALRGEFPLHVVNPGVRRTARLAQ